MKKNSIFIIIGSLFLATACTYQKNNRIEQDDLNESSEWVYGVSRDSAAAQLKNVYTADPKNEARATAIKEKLYGKPIGVTTTAIADSSSSK